MSEKKIALIGDIIGSRKMSNRTDFDHRLSSVLERINYQRPGLLSPYTVTIGDEIQALFSDPYQLFCDTIEIQAAIYPQRMRFSIAIGELVTPINPQSAIGMDGPAFHLARDGISMLKENKDLYILHGNIPFLLLINDALGLISHSMQKWNGNRLKILLELMKYTSVKQIAMKQNLTEQAVYKNIHAGALEKIANMFKQIEIVLMDAVGKP